MKYGLCALTLCAALSITVDAKGKPTPQPQGISLNASAWSIRYSSGVRGPSALQGMLGWFFDFPHDPGYIGYITTPASLAGKSTLTVTAQVVVTSGAPTFNFTFPNDPGNTCPTPPANASLYFERKIDFNGPSKGCGIPCAPEEYRWWSHTRIILTPGVTTVVVPLTIDGWSDTYGQSDPTLFALALANSAQVGMTFGGGCFAGHGVNVVDGGARFILNNYAAQ